MGLLPFYASFPPILHLGIWGFKAPIYPHPFGGGLANNKKIKCSLSRESSWIHI